MKGMALVAFGEPLIPVALDTPDPGAGEVLVKVLACGLCGTDLKIVDGRMAFSRGQHFPHVPGHEVGGEIAARGSGVSMPLGQRVVVFNYWGCGHCLYCMIGNEQLCGDLRGWVGFTTAGGLQEYLVVPADHVVPLPVSIDAVESGTIGCALGTAFHAVVTRGAAQLGEMVAVLGTGGVGLHALQVARATGAYTVAVDIGQAKLDAARRVGANEACLAHEAAELLKDLTGGGGADLVVDCVGTATSQAIALTRKGGRIVQVGYTTSGAQYPPLATDELALRELTLIGSRYFSRPELVSAVDLVARGLVRPVVAGVLPLCEVNAGLEQIRAEKAVGRIVVRVADQ